MSKVKVDVERYDELLGIEIRASLAVKFICREKYIMPETLLRILGTPEAMKEAERLHEEYERRDRERMEKNK